MPLSLPSIPKIFTLTFGLQRFQAMNPVRGGGHQAVDLGEPLWQAEIETTQLSREQGGRYLALFAKARGAMRTIYVGDRSRRRPFAYAASADVGRIGSSTRRIGLSTRKIGQGLVQAWGSPRVTAVDRANSQIELRGLKAGAQITAGDYGHWDDAPARRLHMIVEDVTANASGIAIITVEPAPPATSASLHSIFQMQDACAEMVLLGAAAPFSTRGGHKATIRAAQVLRTVAE